MHSSSYQQGIAALFETDTTTEPASKMTKRDWIAAMCLQGILANKNTTKTTMWSTAQSAVMYADQLLTALDTEFDTGVPLVQGATLPSMPTPITSAAARPNASESVS